MLQKRLEAIPELSPILGCKSLKKALIVLTDTQTWAHNKMKEATANLLSAQEEEQERAQAGVAEGAGNACAEQEETPAAHAQFEQGPAEN